MLAATQIQAESLVDGSADAGKAKALTCTACHGVAGNSANPLWPNIAGQHAKYTETQLHASSILPAMDDALKSAGERFLAASRERDPNAAAAEPLS